MRYLISVLCVVVALAAAAPTLAQVDPPGVSAVANLVAGDLTVADEGGALVPPPPGMPARAGIEPASVPVQPAPGQPTMLAGLLLAALAGLLAVVLSRILSARTRTPAIAQIMSAVVIGLSAVSASTWLIGLSDWKTALMAAALILVTTITGVLTPHAQISMPARPGAPMPANPQGLPPSATMRTRRSLGFARPGGMLALLLLGLLLASLMILLGCSGPQRQAWAQAGTTLGHCLARCGVAAADDMVTTWSNSESVDGAAVGRAAIPCVFDCAVRVGAVVVARVVQPGDSLGATGMASTRAAAPIALDPDPIAAVCGKDGVPTCVIVLRRPAE